MGWPAALACLLGCSEGGKAAAAVGEVGRGVATKGGLSVTREVESCLLILGGGLLRPSASSPSSTYTMARLAFLLNARVD